MKGYHVIAEQLNGFIIEKNEDERNCAFFSKQSRSC